MRKLFIASAALLVWGMSCAYAFAHEHDRERGQQQKSVGRDDALFRASDGRMWVGHQQSERSFITCYGTLIVIEAHDKVVHGMSCEKSRSDLHAGAQRAINTYASYEGFGLVRLTEAYAVGKYAIGAWVGEGGRKGRVILVDDGELWHVLSFGKLNEQEAYARGVPRDVFGMLTGPK